MKQINHDKPGFSLIEAMLSVFVLSIGLLAVVSLIGKSIQHSIDSRDTTIATELAQEGVELMRNVVDNGRLGSGAFNGNSGLPASTNTNCTMNYNTPLATGCVSAAAFALNYDANKYYTHAAGTATKFQRRINVAYDTPARDATTTSATVTSYVSWDGLAPETGANCTVANKCVSVQVIFYTR